MSGYAGTADANGMKDGKRDRALSRWFGYSVAGALTLTAAVGIVATLTEGFGVADMRVLWTLLAITVFSLTALEGVYLARQEDNRAAPIGGLTVIVSLASLATTVLLFWTLNLGDEGSGGGGDSLYRAAAIGLVCSLALGHVSVLLSGRHETDRALVTALLAAAIGCTVGVGVMVSLVFVQAGLEVDGSFWQMVSVTGILALLASLLLAIARRLQRSSET